MATARRLHDKVSLAVRAKSRLGLTARELGGLLGGSKRTMERLVTGRSIVYEDWLEKLAVAVHPLDPGLAEELADAAGRTLQALGIGSPVDAEAAALAAIPARVRVMIVESVVAAAAEALDVSPRLARPAVLAAMERAKAAALGVDDLLAVLRPAPVSSGPRPSPRTPRARAYRRRA